MKPVVNEDSLQSIEEVIGIMRFLKYKRSFFLSIPLVFLFSAGAAFAQGTSFTFQGRLGSAGSPVNDSFDMQFKLFADPTCPPAPAACTPIATITMDGTIGPLVQVTNGGSWSRNRRLRFAQAPAPRRRLERAAPVDQTTGRFATNLPDRHSPEQRRALYAAGAALKDHLVAVCHSQFECD